MGRKVTKEDDYHRIERERIAKLRERALTQNQNDALNYLKTPSNFIKVSGKHIQFVGQPSILIAQRNTFTSLHKRGLLRLDHSDEEADYYTKKEEES